MDKGTTTRKIPLSSSHWLSKALDGKRVGINSEPLCLKCRKAGHVAEKCTKGRWSNDQFHWFLSDERRALASIHQAEDSSQLCERCQGLNILDFLDQDLPWKSTSALNAMARDKSHKFQTLGKAGSIRFWADCPLCVCLFALTPSADSPDRDVLILSDWTMNRLAGETDTVSVMERWDEFSKCLLVTLGGESEGLDFSTKVHRGDAMCILQDQEAHDVLAGRLIDSSTLKIHLVEDWLSSCVKFHAAKCQPTWTTVLDKIKLVDIDIREIVRPPVTGFDYLALSYVWGGIDQPNYQLGSLLGSLPQTIEDAICLTEKLGKRYLWVDSLCIDQSDDTDKMEQIKEMHNIYSGAFLTLVALSSRSAKSGLPRVGQSDTMFPQLSCQVNGKRLVGLMPTLSQQIWRAPWGKRAWTLQEALLSPRCLYIGDHQLYFECNGMQCCESLDDARSWAHHLRLDSSPARGGWLASKVGDGCLRVPIDIESHRIDRYASKLTLYSYRSMTKSEDGLHAFTGILHSLSKMYKNGFFMGLPLEDFQWGLLWRAQYPPKRRLGFPTWSWAGWQGGIWPSFPIDITKSQQYPLHLRIWRAENGRLMPIFQTQHGDQFRHDPLAQVSDLESKGPDFPSNSLEIAEKKSWLLIEALTLQFTPNFATRVGEMRQNGRLLLFRFQVGSAFCLLRILDTDPELETSSDHGPKSFLILARDYQSGWVFHQLMLLRLHWGFATRGTILDLIIHEDHLDILEELQCEKRRVMLA